MSSGFMYTYERMEIPIEKHIKKIIKKYGQKRAKFITCLYDEKQVDKTNEFYELELTNNYEILNEPHLFITERIMEDLQITEDYYKPLYDLILDLTDVEKEKQKYFALLDDTQFEQAIIRCRDDIRSEQLVNEDTTIKVNETYYLKNKKIAEKAFVKYIQSELPFYDAELEDEGEEHMLYTLAKTCVYTCPDTVLTEMYSNYFDIEVSELKSSIMTLGTKTELTQAQMRELVKAPSWLESSSSVPMETAASIFMTQKSMYKVEDLRQAAMFLKKQFNLKGAVSTYNKEELMNFLIENEYDLSEIRRRK